MNFQFGRPALLVAALIVSAHASAAGKLAIEGESSCPSRAEVQKALGKRIANCPSGSRIRVLLRQNGLELHFAPGKKAPELSRTFSGGTDECAAIAEAAGVLLEGWVQERLAQQPRKEENANGRGQARGDKTDAGVVASNSDHGTGFDGDSGTPDIPFVDRTTSDEFAVGADGGTSTGSGNAAGSQAQDGGSRIVETGSGTGLAAIRADGGSALGAAGSDGGTRPVVNGSNGTELASTGGDGGTGLAANGSNNSELTSTDAGSALSSSNPNEPSDAGTPLGSNSIGAHTDTGIPKEIRRFGFAGVAEGGILIGRDDLKLGVGARVHVGFTPRIGAVLEASGDESHNNQKPPGEVSASIIRLGILSKLALHDPGENGVEFLLGPELERISAASSGYSVTGAATLYDPGLTAAAQWHHELSAGLFVDLFVALDSRLRTEHLLIDPLGVAMTLPAFHFRSGLSLGWGL